MKIFNLLLIIFFHLFFLNPSLFSYNPIDENIDYKPTQIQNLEIIQNINGAFNNPGSFSFSFQLMDKEKHNLFFLSRENFKIYIGKQLVKNLLFQNSYEGYKIYIPRLPYQNRNGVFDLRIQVYLKQKKELDIVKKNFLRYRAPGINLILIVDTSASMYWNDKPNFRQRAIKNIVQYAKISGLISKIALIRFSTLPETLCPLTSIDNIKVIEKAISQINATGETDIGSALDKAYEELIKTSKREKTVVILLTDGENGAPYKKNHVKFNNFHTPVYTIGLKQNINVEFLNTIAQETGGTFYKIFDSFKLHNIYNEIINRESNSKIFISKDFYLRPNQSTNIYFYPDRSMRKVNIFSFWEQEDILITIKPTIKKDNLFRFNNFEFFDLRDLSQKRYTIQIKNRANRMNQCSLQGFVNSSISANSLIAKDVYYLNEPVEMSALVYQDDYPIMDAQILADIRLEKKNYHVLLFDDGLHNDGNKNDGFYKNYFFNQEPGDYNITFKITGKNLYGEKFVREQERTFITLNKKNDNLKVIPEDVNFNKVGSDNLYYLSFKLLSSYSNTMSIKVFPLNFFFGNQTNNNLAVRIMIKPDYFILEPQKNKLFNVNVNISKKEENGKYHGHLILMANKNYFMIPIQLDFYKYHLPHNKEWIKK